MYFICFWEAVLPMSRNVVVPMGFLTFWGGLGATCGPARPGPARPGPAGERRGGIL